MKNKILLIIVVVLMFIYIYERSLDKKTSFFNNTQNIEVLDKNTGNIDSIEIEKYVIGVVAGEMPASFNEEALKAQAIASRTFAYYKIQNSNKDYDLTKDKTSQVYLTEEEMHNKWKENFDKYYERVKEAVNDTSNLVLTYNGSIISSYYFSMSNGKTENVQNVFGEKKDYLQSVDSKENKENKNYEVVKTISINEFKNLLGINEEEILVNNIEKNESNRIETIVINNKKYSGIDLRKLLDLRSTDFKLDISNDIKITTFGYGHGVGMSQYGANEMAKEDKKYDEILSHYYTGIKIVNVNSII